MSAKTQQARADLRAKLIDIAERLMAEGGLAAVKARPLAAEAGCAVGAIYNVFGDLNDLILSVNMRTFARLGIEVGDSISPDTPPDQALVTLAKAYLRFAMKHARLWRCLFDVELTEHSQVPQWYREELARLFAYIAAPVGRLHPHLTDSDRALFTRALFSSIHGIVWLGLENRMSGVPVDQLDRMIEMVLSNISK